MAHFLALLCIRKCLDNFYFTLDYLEKMHRFLKFVKDQKDSSCFFLSVWFCYYKRKIKSACCQFGSISPNPNVTCLDSLLRQSSFGTFCIAQECNIQWQLMRRRQKRHFPKNRFYLLVASAVCIFFKEKQQCVKRSCLRGAPCHYACSCGGGHPPTTQKISSVPLLLLLLLHGSPALCGKLSRGGI